MERRRRAALTWAAARPERRTGIRFFAAPPGASPEELVASDVLEPKLPEVPNAAEEALSGAAFRQMRARDRLRAVLTSDDAPVADDGRANAVFARPPGDLPALMGLAEQLEALAEADGRERALVWSCGSCATRYAIPVAALRSGSLRCERCGAEVDLSPQRSLGEHRARAPIGGRDLLCPQGAGCLLPRGHGPRLARLRFERATAVKPLCRGAPCG